MQSPSISSSTPIAKPRSEISIRNLPVNLFGSVMGLSGLALAWRLAHSSLGAPAFIGDAVGVFALGIFALIALGYLVKFVKYPEAVLTEFRHPVAGNFFGTIAISMLLLSAVVDVYSAPAAKIFWVIGMLGAFTLCFVVVSRLLNGQVDASNAVPAWLIPGVAILDITVTGAHMPWAAEINLFAGAVGAILALVLIVLIMSRLVHRDALAPAMMPSLMILVAPFAVGFLAYTNIIGNIDRFAALLFYFGLFMFIVIAPKVFRRSIPFSSGWWAISFPMAALTCAALRYAEFRDSAPLWFVAIGLLGILSFALTLLTVKTIRMAVNGKLFT